MGRRALREGVNGGEWVLEEGGRWIGGWERWLVKECVGGGWSCVGARVDVERGIASVGCVLGVCRF